MTTASDLIARLRAAGQTIAAAESVTGGLLCSALIDIPGASQVVRGGVVAYTADLKVSALGVDAALVAECGTIDEAVAAQMATGVRERLGAGLGVATTGNAGPEASEGKPVGLVCIAVADAAGVVTRRLVASGDRSAIRRAAVLAALSLAADRLGEETLGTPG